jgi:hypothetical protein
MFILSRHRNAPTNYYLFIVAVEIDITDYYIFIVAI